MEDHGDLHSLHQSYAAFHPKRVNISFIDEKNQKISTIIVGA